MSTPVENKSSRSGLTRLFMIVAAAGLLLGAGQGCMEDPVVDQPQQSAGPKGDRPSGPAARGPRKGAVAKKPKGRTLRVQQGDVVWTPQQNWVPRITADRDPFYGFVDEIVAERERQRAEAQQREMETEEILLPAQRYDVREFRLVAVVTNTANPKALLLDPRGVPHTLNKADLIGNKNGVLVDIRRNEIEILQGQDIVNSPETIIMKLHPEPKGIKMEVN